MTQNEFADQLFTMGNVIAGFYVAQNIVFANVLLKSRDLIDRIQTDRGRKVAQVATWGIAGLYVFAIIFCFVVEFILRWRTGLANYALAVGLARAILVVLTAGGTSYALHQLSTTKFSPLPFPGWRK